MEHIVFEVGLALALIALAGFLSVKLKFSIVPFYILVGMVVGPHAPDIGLFDLRFIQSAPLIEFMGRVGVLFLLFYLGLEFSVGRLIKAGRSIAVGGTIYIVINFTLGLLFGWVAGFPLKEILIIAGITTISSSAIVAKVLVDLKRTANRETEMILGIIMFEDIFLAVYISIVSGLVLSGATSLMGVLSSALIALGYMLLLIIVGRKLVPFLNRALNIKSNEVFMITVFAALFLIAGFSETIHVAEAIGALLVGLILAETQHMKRIEHMILPFRDFFGAMFFFSFGLTIDPLSLGGAVWLSIGAVIVTIIGNVAAGMLAGKSAGLNAKASTNIGLTIVSRGEFSIIMANLGKAGALMEILQPFAALYVLILAILGPLLTKESKKIYGLLSKILPVDKAVPAKQTDNNPNT
ncbi:cation:proton antiporter [Brevibacillus nitrificans]|uniref:Cation:proton antiporter n=1 Tax=Brevibacillus nitrificans TaxID=651560 RepID=A0A3M8D7D9_9BACL|nr:cation:proton antiporter [Brevibacillus nitrificans]RNB83753.1 cation:proton antiporter [Brevibacillus nitrificans]